MVPLIKPPNLKNLYEIVNEKPDHNHKPSNMNSVTLMANFESGILIAISVNTIKYASECIFVLDFIMYSIEA